MIIKLYKVDDGVNVLNKSLLNPLTFNIIARQDFDIINPNIYLVDVNSDIEKYNYCVIEELNRCYFINSVSMVNGSIVLLECGCDVLESFKSDVLSSKARFKRGVRTGDYYNGDVDLNINQDVVLYNSDKGFEGLPTMVLTTVGGV